MRKGLVLIMLCACGGVAGNIPEDFTTYGFKASVEVATANPEPGKHVDLIVAVTSTGNVPVLCDVTLRVVSLQGDEIYAQHWEGVQFMPDSPWNLANGFLAATDVKKSYNLSIEVRRHDTGELLYSNASVSTLEFAGAPN